MTKRNAAVNNPCLKVQSVIIMPFFILSCDLQGIRHRTSPVRVSEPLFGPLHYALEKTEAKNIDLSFIFPAQ